jgi:hypothetical protein
VTPIADDPFGRDEFDTPAEVDAVFRTQRRIAVAHFAVFLAGLLSIPVLTLLSGWSSENRVAQWATGFVAIGAGLYLFFFLLGMAAASLANGVEQRMLGTPTDADAADPDSR